MQNEWQQVSEVRGLFMERIKSHDYTKRSMFPVAGETVWKHKNHHYRIKLTESQIQAMMAQFMEPA